MIDLHSHILPGIDDGSKTVEESLQMLRAMAAQGVDTVAATPHFYPKKRSPQEFLRRRQKAWDTLRPHLFDGCPRILLGAEVLYFEGICHAEEICALRIEGTRLLLLEMPMAQWNDRLIDNVLQMNFWPETTIVLAHIERFLPLQKKGVLEYLQDNDVLMQVNAEFFLRWQTRHRALRMFKNREIDFLGSDCHNMTTRAPRVGEASDRICKKLGKESLAEFIGHERQLLFAGQKNGI